MSALSKCSGDSFVTCESHHTGKGVADCLINADGCVYIHIRHFDVFSTVHHSIELFHQPTLMYNSLFTNNKYVTLLSSTCFEH